MRRIASDKRQRALDAVQGGTPLEQAARLEGVSSRSVRRWLRLGREQDATLALSGRMPGPRQRFTDATTRALLGLLQRPPFHYGHNAPRWTLRTVADTLVRQGHVERISTESIRRLVTDAGYSWERARAWAEEKSAGTQLRASERQRLRLRRAVARNTPPEETVP